MSGSSGLVADRGDGPVVSRPEKEMGNKRIVLGLLAIIVLGQIGITFWTLNGNSRQILHTLAVDLPKLHGRGGQDALQSAWLKLRNYMIKTAELAKQFFIEPDTGQPTVSGLILAGPAEFKTMLNQSDMFDPRLRAKILKVVEVSFGGEIGFNEAIDHSSDILSDVKFIQEKRLIRKYFKLLSQEGTESTDSNEKQVFAVAGLNDTLYAIDQGVVETLIVWENLGINRYVFKNSVTSEIIIKHLNHEQEADRNNFLDPAISSELEVQEVRSFLEWSAHIRCEHESVNNQSLEGSQFCRGLGGIGAILRVRKYRSPGTAFVKIGTVSVKIVRMKDEEDGEDEPKLKAIYVFGK